MLVSSHSGVWIKKPTFGNRSYFHTSIFLPFFNSLTLTFPSLTLTLTMTLGSWSAKVVFTLAVAVMCLCLSVYLIKVPSNVHGWRELTGWADNQSYAESGGRWWGKTASVYCALFTLALWLCFNQLKWRRCCDKSADNSAQLMMEFSLLRLLFLVSFFLWFLHFFHSSCPNVSFLLAF